MEIVILLPPAVLLELEALELLADELLLLLEVAVLDGSDEVSDEIILEIAEGVVISK